MRNLKITLGLLAAMVASAACASPGPVAVTDAERSSAEAMFERIKGMEGTWVTVDTGEESPAPPGTPMKYEVTASGSAVIETVFEGGAHEMVTVYTVDNGRLTLTHYCAMGNQPHMVADPITDPNVVSFEADSVGNLADPDDGHMHWGRLEFLDDGRVRSVWTVLKAGEKGFVANMLLERADG